MEDQSSFAIAKNFKGSKATLRIGYKLEVELIKKDIGSLDTVRIGLGLSRRKLCQLLLVDPSAWTRWIKTDAPPHIYRALQWLVQLKKINPDAAHPSDISSRVDYIHESTKNKIAELEATIALLESAIKLSLLPPSHSEQKQVIKNELKTTKKRLKRKINLRNQRYIRKVTVKNIKKKNKLATTYMESKKNRKKTRLKKKTKSPIQTKKLSVKKSNKTVKRKK